MSASSESETVGYKQPPRKTQFKPGKSGNPRGRPKRKVNMSESLNRVLDDKIVVTGFAKGKTGLEAFVQSIVDRVLQGDPKAIPALMRLFSKTTLFKPTPRPGQMTGVVVMPPEYWDDPPEVHNGKLYRSSGGTVSIIGAPYAPFGGSANDRQ